jgi:hypothetical protein
MLKFPPQIPILNLMRLRRLVIGSAAAVAALTAAPAALADTSVSANWAGYAIHRSGVRFRQVSAIWKQPSASCTPGIPTYAAVWVGLGGFSRSSNALEQIGTEVDCSASGKVITSAWYELVPDASNVIHLGVRPGDVVSASVTVVGHKVVLALNDATRHKSFSKTFRHAAIDVTSAEWIVEAPSDCVSATACQTLPLANFGTTNFALATATTTKGQRGTISSPAIWGTTSIALSPGAHRFVSLKAAGTTGAATPSPLATDGSTFSVSYQELPGLPINPPLGSRRAAPDVAQLKHR